MKRFSEFLTERKNKSYQDKLDEMRKAFESTSRLSEEESKKLLENYLSDKGSTAAAVQMMKFLDSSQSAKVLEGVRKLASERAAVMIGLTESPASERLVRGVARSVIRDHHEELERLAYK
ncbi:hypothetical protein VXP84_01120 [Acinetobacter oleivorans]|uniref:hypothetical protein n=1 Tax=Acinetobacter oleivorans TaxID=1148157 RepID=UPI0019010B5E|nr:hypothetical protein [Acinetobacter oleivorans]MBJ9739419.1 hypothetical protein [Acinetobacter oleivorans]MCU4410008.1 hypothetical protein [Acinetobacter oleivorans]